MRQSGSNVQMMHIRRLMESIDAGQISIPDFQRDFDWSPSDVKQLLITVFAGWPAGSLLLLDSRNTLFKARRIEGGPSLAEVQTYSVLDGQQRLTSLYHAFYDKGDVIYAIAWDQDSDEVEDCLRSYTRRQWLAAKLDALPQQTKHRLLPISALKTPSDFFQWRDESIDLLSEEEREAARQAVTAFYKKNLSSAHDYEFPAVILESNLAPEAIARIFERVNRTGLKLDVFDLMVAKTFTSDWNLREQWQSCRVRFPAVAEYLADDGIPLLEAIALREKGDIRKSAVLSLDAANIRARWASAEEAAGAVIRFLREECGAIRPDFVPYRTMISLLIALQMDDYLAKQKKEAFEWFIKASFDESFDVASNSRIVYHYKALSAKNFERLEFAGTILDLSTLTRRNSKAIWAAYACYLATLVSNLYGLEQCEELSMAELFSDDDFKGQNVNSIISAKSILNYCLVPSKFASKFAIMNFTDGMEFAKLSGFYDLVRAQLPEECDIAPQILPLFFSRTAAVSKVVNSEGVFKTDIEMGVYNIE